MSNPFDQFDQPNPFNQFDEPTRRQQLLQAMARTPEEKAALEANKKLLSMGFGDTLYGAGQMAAHGVEALTGGKYLSSKADQAVAERRAEADRLTQQGGTEWARTAGNVVSPTGMVGKAGSLIKALLYGAGQSALTPVEKNQDDYWGQAGKNAALGAGIAGVPTAVAAGASRLVPVAQETAELLRNGVAPTLGMGSDPNTKMGRGLRWLENQLEVMPLSGIPMRPAMEKPREQILDRAMDLATPPGYPAPKGDRVERLRELATENADRINRAMETTQIPIDRSVQAHFESVIDQQAARFKLTDDEKQKIKDEMEKRLWTPNQGEFVSGTVFGNVAKDLPNFKFARDNTNMVNVLRETAYQMKEFIKDVAEDVHNIPLRDINEASANRWALSRAGGSDNGTTGRRILKGIDANDAANGRIPGDTLTRDLRDLGDAGKHITEPQKSWVSRDPSQLAKELAFQSGGAMLSFVPQALTMGYGKLNQSDLFKRYMLGDPVARKLIQDALANVNQVAVPAVVRSPQEQ